ncbi:TIGR03013 family XrtA/PEP-CTERM system glycosyltransferase [Magnetofaba australis]|uniref:Putative sugar transferase n=1 Tax=Magnetofaba australis IT-1 TaxID=1434232 RepID=A0A1Y2KAK6_9PROT|nr:TIGR03013 family XrtA/PEP-CTERM system glycosyltransferase [Magnetofaba australis]OSM06845.1 putative sugar transferase [Magnetofaba australis IT-1]
MIRIFKHYISRWSLLLVFIEAMIFTGSVYIGVNLRFLGETPGPEDAHADLLLPRAAFFAAVMLISMTATGRYQRLMDEGMAGEALSVGLSFIIGLVAASVLFYVLPDLFIGRGAFGYALAAALLLTLTGRWLFYRFLLDASLLKRRILVYGAGERARLVEQLDNAETHNDIRVVGFWPIPGEAQHAHPSRVVAQGGDLLSWCRRQSIHEIVVACDNNLPDLAASSLLDCKVNRINVIDLPSFFEREQRMINLDVLGNAWWVFNSEGVTRSMIEDSAKKAFDIIVSLIGIIVLSPVMVAAALAVLIESGGRGPIFYRQARVGFGGRIFHVMKFRSMRTDAEKDGPQWASRNDSRVTRVGRVIRNTRIDELPQFFNVLRGEMSLVGPRPERPEFVELLQSKIPYFKERLRVKPGITGWAQIKYGYGSSVQDAEEKLKYDLYYVKNHTLFFDLLVLVHSVEVVLFGRGAEQPITPKTPTQEAYSPWPPDDNPNR